MKKYVALLGLLALLEDHSAWAATFEVTNGQNDPNAKTLATGQAGTVDAGGMLSVAGATDAISVTGNATLTNNGTILQTGTGRGIRDNTGKLTLTVTNGVGATIQTADADVIQMNKKNSNITFNNAGTLISLNASAGGSQAIDFNAITTGTNVLNNAATGLIEANEADAVRPGVNGVVNNDGIIRSTNNPGSTDSSDGVDLQSNTGITVVNATTGTQTTPGTGLIEGARHGITGGNKDTTTDGTFALSVTNNLGGTIQGDNGSGINIDGLNGNELVTVINHGTIIGNGVAGDGDGVDVDGLVHLTNTGTILSKQAFNDVSEGVTVGGGTIVNSGAIEGDNVNGGLARGITLAGLDKDPDTDAPIPVQGIYGDTTITNSGLIKGQNGAGIAATGAATNFKLSITNLAGGTIEGGNASEAAIATGANNATIVDYGTITALAGAKAVDLGSGNSSLQILGGSAQITGDISGGTGSSTLSIVPGAGNSFSYSGVISNFAGVAIGDGTVSLSGASTYSGDTTVTGGTLVLANSQAIGTGRLIAAASTIVYTQGVNLANAIVLQGDTTLDVEGSDAATQSGVISGSAGLTKTGSGSLLLAGTNTYTGNTLVQAGTLAIGDDASPTAAVAGNVQVAQGATLRGHGSIGGSVINDGTVAPGGSIGTLTIVGNYREIKVCVLSIYATPTGAASRLAIGGKASLDGSTVVLAQAGNWAPLTNYTILTANQGISGQFAGATSSLAFLTPVLTYSANSVNLSLQRNDIQFVSLARTANERASAAAADTLGFASPVYTALTQLQAAQAPQAFNQLSGELYASARTALFDDSRYVRDAVNNHLLGQENATNGTQASDANGVSAWTAAWGHWGDHDADGDASRLQANGSGLLLGADLGIGSNARIGAVAGRGQTSIRVDDIGSSAHATSTHLGFYGSVNSGGFQLQGGVDYAWQQVDSTRHVAFGQFVGTNAGRYDANTAQAYIDGGYRFAIGQNTSLEPYLNVAQVRIKSDAFAESGSSAALAVQGDTSQQTSATLGLRVNFALAPGGLRAYAGLGWQHAWGDTQSTSTQHFVAGGLDAFTVEGVPVAQNAAAATFGLSFPLSRSVTVDTSYQGQFASHAKDQAARMSLTVVF